MAGDSRIDILEVAKCSKVLAVGNEVTALGLLDGWDIEVRILNHLQVRSRQKPDQTSYKHEKTSSLVELHGAKQN